MNHRFLATAVSVSLSVIGTAAQAGVVSLHFGGMVDSVSPLVADSFHVGDAASVALVYDSAAVALPGSTSSRAGYDLIELDVTFGGYAASYPTDPAHLSFMTMINNDSTGLGTADTIGGTGFGAFAGPAVAGLPLRSAFVSLFDFTQTVFGDTTLPTSLNLADFQTRVAGLQFCANAGCGVGSDESEVSATIDSLTIAGTVPELPSSLLVALGLCALLATQVRRRRPTTVGLPPAVEPR
jgi:hypothetical protein